MSGGPYGASKAASGRSPERGVGLGPQRQRERRGARCDAHPVTARAFGDASALDAAVASGPLANLLGRVSEPEDMANVVAFLCLPASRQITGQIVHTSAGAVV